MSWGLATLRLLTASVMNGLSGTFKIIIAYLLVGNNIILYNTFAGFLIIYAIYTFDRTKGGEEDKINRNDISEARKDIPFFICILSSFIGALILFLNDLLYVAVIPFFVGYLYNKRICIKNFSFKIKGGRGAKNVIVAMAWGIFITGIAVDSNIGCIKTVLVFLFITAKTFITTIMNDFSDVKGDKAAGLMTLPIYLGEKVTRILLMTVHLLGHGLIAMTMITGLLEFEFIILISLFFSGIFYITLFTRTINIADSLFMRLLYYLFYRAELYVAIGLRIVYLNFI